MNKIITLLCVAATFLFVACESSEPVENESGGLSISQYMLVKEYNISKSLLHRLRNNQGVNMNTIDTLCDILDCDIEDIATHYNSEE